MFATVTNFHPDLIVNPGAYPTRRLGLVLRYSTLVGSTHAYKFQTGAKVTDCDKHSSLLQIDIDYSRKKFYSTGPRAVTRMGDNLFKISNHLKPEGLHYKTFYNCNFYLRVSKCFLQRQNLI